MSGPARLTHGLLLTAFPVAVLLVGCASAWDPIGASPGSDEVAVQLEPTAVPPTKTPSAPIVRLATRTLPPTASQTQLPSALATPTPPPISPTATVTSEPYSYVDDIDRTCPDPAPGKPAYERYWLDSDPWPTPAPGHDSHLWLSLPFLRADRLLTSAILPYGSDGQGRYLLHNGVDLAEPEGVPVLAVADGVVVYAGSDADKLWGWRCNWYGRLVILLLDEQWQNQDVYILYGHVLGISVSPGQRVQRFEELAEVGHGGVALVPHLHLEVRVGSNTFGATRNPLLWITPGDRRGAAAGRLVDPEGKPWQGYPVEFVGPNESADRMLAWTYIGDPEGLIQPDERYAENFAFSDLAPGLYEVVTSVQGTIYRSEVNVLAGEISTVELVTDFYRTPTPAPPAPETATPEP